MQWFLDMPTSTKIATGAAVIAVLLGVFGVIDGAKMAGWLEAIYGNVMGAAE